MPSVIVRWVSDSGAYIYYSYYSKPGIPNKEESYCGGLIEVCDQLGLDVRETEDVEEVIDKLEFEIKSTDPEEFVESIERLDVERVSPRANLTFIEQVSEIRERIRSKHKPLDSFVGEIIPKMGVIVTKEADSEVHAYLLWKEDGRVEQLHCGPVPAILQSLTEIYPLTSVLYGFDDDVSRRELTELLEILIDELTAEQVVEQLDLDVANLNGIRGPVTAEPIIKGNMTLDYFLPQEHRIILSEDIPNDLSPRDTDPGQVDQSPSSKGEIEESQDLRVERERDYSERVTQDRGHDPYTDEVKTLYHNQCAFCGLKVEMPKGENGENYALESAHIQRAADDGPDTPPNRVALCPFHHWAFDNGWLSLTDDHTVLVKEAPEYDGHDKLKSLHDGQILLPDDPEVHPRPQFLQKHREKHGFTD